MREQVIVALDCPTPRENLELVRTLRGRASWFKVGMRLFYQDPDPIIAEIRSQRAHLFLDLKLHDIPNTVASAVQSLSTLEPELLTIHGLGGRGMIEAARHAVEVHSPNTRLLAVTILTSMDTEDFGALGLRVDPNIAAESIAKAALSAGAHGIVCSGHEASRVRSLSDSSLIVTPGIRMPDNHGGDDQKRVMTPAAAIRAGATHLVVGRPIYQSTDPVAAFESLVASS